MNKFLFINTNFLSNIKKSDLRNNLKDNDFLYYIHDEFRNIAKNFPDNFYEFLSKIKNKNNNSLFYIGLEEKLKKDFLIKRQEVEKFFHSTFEFKEDYSIYLVKTKIGKSKKISLLSILILLTKNNIEDFYNPNLHKKYLFFLFPLSLDDFH